MRKHPVCPSLDVLAGDGRQQLRGLGQHCGQLPPLQHRQGRVRLADQRVGAARSITRPRSWVTVSWVATASSSGVESSTRRRPLNNPAARAVAFTSSNNRRGRSLPRSRLRIPTNTVG
jgi:hypothetical protein